MDVTKKILYVDDDTDDREIFQEIVHEIYPQIKCWVAKDATEALRLLSTSFQPDCIFIDINMPVVSGIDLLKILRANPLYSQTSIIILTTSNSHVDQTKALGASGYFVKPNTYHQLLEVIKTCSALHEK